MLFLACLFVYLLGVFFGVGGGGGFALVYFALFFLFFCTFSHTHLWIPDVVSIYVYVM